MSSWIPLFVSLDGATVVVTGAGPAARRAATRLASAGARVRLVAPVPPDVAGCEAIAATPDGSHLAGALLLVLASESRETDAAIARAACERPVMTVSATGPEGQAFMGSAEDRGGLVVATCARGQSEPLEQRLSGAAAATVEPHHARLAEILGSIRGKLEERIPDDATREAIWEQILDSPVALLLQSGSDDEAVEMAERMAWGTG